jgi:hypothetical protein
MIENLISRLTIPWINHRTTMKSECNLFINNGGVLLESENKHVQFSSLISYTEKMRHELGSSGASVIVIQNDKIVTEWYEGYHHFKKGARNVTTDSQFNVYSTRKTYIGLATAIAIVEGMIDIDTPIYDYIDDIPKEYLGELTIRNLATKKGPKYVGTERVEKEGLLVKIVKDVTGYSIAELISKRVLEPLQLTKTEWATEPKESLVCDFENPDGYASVRIESNEECESYLKRCLN